MDDERLDEMAAFAQREHERADKAEAEVARLRAVIDVQRTGHGPCNDAVDAERARADALEGALRGDKTDRSCPSCGYPSPAGPTVAALLTEAARIIRSTMQESLVGDHWRGKGQISQAANTVEWLAEMLPARSGDKSGDKP